jgi:hypothetical protein
MTEGAPTFTVGGRLFTMMEPLDPEAPNRSLPVFKMLLVVMEISAVPFPLHCERVISREVNPEPDNPIVQLTPGDASRVMFAVVRVICERRASSAASIE